VVLISHTYTHTSTHHTDPHMTHPHTAQIHTCTHAQHHTDSYTHSCMKCYPRFNRSIGVAYFACQQFTVYTPHHNTCYEYSLGTFEIRT